MDSREKRLTHSTTDFHHDHDDDRGHDGVEPVPRGCRAGRVEDQLGRERPAAPRATRLPGQIQPAADRSAGRLLGPVQLRTGSPVVPVRRVHHVHHPRRLYVPRQSGTIVGQVITSYFVNSIQLEAADKSARSI